MKNKGIINNAIRLFISKPLKITNARRFTKPIALNTKPCFIEILGISIASLLLVIAVPLKRYPYFTAIV